MDLINLAVQLLIEGDVVAFPTETVYGLGAHAFSKEGIDKIFRLKGRARDNPLILHIHDLAQVSNLARDIPPSFYKLAERFFPGPLTVVLPKQPHIDQAITAGLDTVAFRMPSHPVPRQLLQSLGSPIAAPSANLSGRPSPTKREHVLEDFPTGLSLILDGGPCEVGIESTVIDLSSPVPTLLRPGTITREALEECLSLHVSLHRSNGEAAKAPGMKYRHYAPKAKILLRETWESILHEVQSFSSPLILSNQPPPKELHSHLVLPLNSQKLYGSFRLADQHSLFPIFVLCDLSVLADLALMNRLELASRG